METAVTHLVNSTVSISHLHFLEYAAAQAPELSNVHDDRERKKRIGPSVVYEELTQLAIHHEELTNENHREMLTLIRRGALGHSRQRALLLRARGMAQLGGQQPWINPENVPAGESLKKYGRDLTEIARDGKLDPVIGREEQIRRAVQILSRRTKNNPVLIGEPGVGKTAIAEGLAQRIALGTYYCVYLHMSDSWFGNGLLLTVTCVIAW